MKRIGSAKRLRSSQRRIEPQTAAWLMRWARRVRERERDAIERHVVGDGPKTSLAAHPLAKARDHSPAILPTGRAYAGVLDEEHAVAGARQYGHQALVLLPEEIPVDRRDADDVSVCGAPPCYRVPATARSIDAGTESEDR